MPTTMHGGGDGGCGGVGGGVGVGVDVGGGGGGGDGGRGGGGGLLGVGPESELVEDVRLYLGELAVEVRLEAGLEHRDLAEHLAHRALHEQHRGHRVHLLDPVAPHEPRVRLREARG